MKNKILLLIGIAPAILFSCKPTPCADVLIKKDTTFKSERENTLFAFIGEKIEVKHIPYKGTEMVMDNEFRAKYKVLQRIYGCYPGDTIEFTAFDHYGWPDFSQYKNTLLYLSEFEGKYYHEKYQYDDVYMTKSGKWAGPFEPYDADDYTKLHIIPKRIEFTDSVTFPLNTGHDYPHPFYWTVGNKAIADYGIYAEDLFKVKKEGVLTARGLFGKEEEEDQRLIPQDVELEEVPAPDSEKGKVEAFWQKFAGWLVQKDMAHINQTLLDSLWVCGSLFTKQKLLSGCFNEIFDSTVVAKLKRQKDISQTYTDVELKDLLPCARNRIVKDCEGYYRIKRLALFVHIYPENVSRIELSFIKTKNSYRLYDIRYTSNRSCCF